MLMAYIINLKVKKRLSVLSKNSKKLFKKRFNNIKIKNKIFEIYSSAS